MIKNEYDARHSINSHLRSIIIHANPRPNFDIDIQTDEEKYFVEFRNRQIHLRSTLAWLLFFL